MNGTHPPLVIYEQRFCFMVFLMHMIRIANAIDFRSPFFSLNSTCIFCNSYCTLCPGIYKKIFLRCYMHTGTQDKVILCKPGIKINGSKLGGKQNNWALYHQDLPSGLAPPSYTETRRLTANTHTSHISYLLKYIRLYI